MGTATIAAVGIVLAAAVTAWGAVSVAKLNRIRDADAAHHGRVDVALLELHGVVTRGFERVHDRVDDAVAMTTAVQVQAATDHAEIRSELDALDRKFEDHIQGRDAP